MYLTLNTISPPRLLLNYQNQTRDLSPASAGRHRPPCSKRESVCVCHAGESATWENGERGVRMRKNPKCPYIYIPSAISGKYGRSKLQTVSTSLMEAGLLRGPPPASLLMNLLMRSFLVLLKMGCSSSKIDVYFRGLSRIIIYVVVYKDNIKYYLNICIYLSYFKK